VNIESRVASDLACAIEEKVRFYLLKKEAVEKEKPLDE